MNSEEVTSKKTASTFVPADFLAPLDGLEPTTPWLTVTCSANWAKEAIYKQENSYSPFSCLSVGIDLSFRSVARQVFSAPQSLTSVFGMGTGGPSALKTPTMCQHWPIFPVGRPTSIFGTAELNFCVRNGNRWTLCVRNTDLFSVTAKLSPSCHSEILHFKNIWNL